MTKCVQTVLRHVLADKKLFLGNQIRFFRLQCQMKIPQKLLPETSKVISQADKAHELPMNVKELLDDEMMLSLTEILNKADKINHPAAGLMRSCLFQLRVCSD